MYVNYKKISKYRIQIIDRDVEFTSKTFLVNLRKLR